MTSALEQAIAIVSAGVLPETFWDTEDDLCDCTYQRIGMWTNPYLAETLEVRWCCIWAELSKLFPDFVRVTPAFNDYNAHEWVTEPAEWTAEFDMPRAIWYRQLARKTGRTVADIREEYRMRDDERPRGVPRPPEPVQESVDMFEVMWLAIQGLADEIAELKKGQG